MGGVKLKKFFMGVDGFGLRGLIYGLLTAFVNRQC